MNKSYTADIQAVEGIHAETKVRDPSFIMSGHHCHVCYELFYVHSGECRIIIDDRFHDLRAGDFILIPPMVLHYTRYLTGACQRTVILFRRQDIAEEVQQHLPQTAQFFAETSLFHTPEKARTQVENAVRLLVEEERQMDACTLSLRRCYLQSLLLICSRVCSFRPGGMDGIQTTDPHVLAAARYISEHYTQPITTLDVAQAVGFSPNYLSRRFRASAGIGLHEYIVFVRLHHAAQELIVTADSITSIALRCGFSDSNYFKDSFKKKYGVTPRTYRKLA